MSQPMTNNGGQVPNKPNHFRKYNLVPTQFANLGKSERHTGERRFAYCKIEGPKRPGIVYIPGYFSKMYIAKANVIEHFCINNGYPFLKYDPEGIGESRTESAEMSYAEWFEDACYVIEQLTDGPQLLVSSSNGAWMSLILVKKYPHRIHSMVMIGAAINYGLDDDLFERLLQSLDPEMAQRVKAGETIRFNSGWGVEITASKRFLDELNAHRINMEKPLDISCPIRIIHSMQDQSVLWTNCLRLMDIINNDDVRLYLKKRGNHRLVTDEDLQLELQVVKELVTQYPVGEKMPQHSRVPVSEVQAVEHPPTQSPEPSSFSDVALLPQTLMDGLMGEMGKRNTLPTNERGEVRSKL